MTAQVWNCWQILWTARPLQLYDILPPLTWTDIQHPHHHSLLFIIPPHHHSLLFISPPHHHHSLLFISPPHHHHSLLFISPPHHHHSLLFISPPHHHHSLHAVSFHHRCSPLVWNILPPNNCPLPVSVGVCHCLLVLYRHL